jgi:hypothetical protein
VSSNLGYDIFKKLEDDSALWIEDAATLEKAKERLKALASAKPGSYFVRDATTGRILGNWDSAACDGKCA